MPNDFYDARFLIENQEIEEKEPMKKWEYKNIHRTDEDWEKKTLVELLNEAGEEGWEFTGHTNDTGRGVEYLVKREKPVTVVQKVKGVVTQ